MDDKPPMLKLYVWRAEDARVCVAELPYSVFESPEFVRVRVLGGRSCLSACLWASRAMM